MNKIITLLLIGISCLFAQNYTFKGNVESIKEQGQFIVVDGVMSNEKIYDEFRPLKLNQEDKNLIEVSKNIEVGDYIEAELSSNNDLKFEIKKENKNLLIKIIDGKLTKNITERKTLNNISNTQNENKVVEEKLTNKEKSDIEAKNYNIAMKLIEFDKYQKALEYLEKNSDKESLYTAGMIYANKLKNKDFDKALALLNESCSKGHLFACGSRSDLVDDFNEKSDLINEVYRKYPDFAREKNYHQGEFNVVKHNNFIKRKKRGHAINFSRSMSYPKGSLHSFDKIDDLYYAFYDDKNIAKNKDNSILSNVLQYESTIDSSYLTNVKIVRFGIDKDATLYNTFVLAKKGRVVGIYGKFEKEYDYKKEFSDPKFYFRNLGQSIKGDVFDKINKKYLKDKTKFVTEYKVGDNSFNLEFSDLLHYSIPELGFNSNFQKAFDDEIVKLLVEEQETFKVVLKVKDRINYKKLLSKMFRDKGSDQYEIFTYYKNKKGEIKYSIEFLEIDPFAVEYLNQI